MEAGEPVPWKMGDSPADFITMMLQAIVGIEIEVTRLVGKAKLSQNKASVDRQGAVEGVRQRGENAVDAATSADALADAMLKAPPLI
jgi:transcriptional regulator